MRVGEFFNLMLVAGDAAGLTLITGLVLEGANFAIASGKAAAETVIRAKLIVDQRQACLKEAGDLLIPLRQGKMKTDHIHAELGELVTGKKEGRGSNSEISIFKSVGNAVQDLVTAGRIYENAVKTGAGSEIDL